MKTWTQGWPRDGHSVTPTLVDQDVASLRASIQGLDRTQLPEDSFDLDEIGNYAKHRVWFLSKSEQDNSVDTNIEASQSWQAATISEAAAGWQVFDTMTLTGHKGGSIQVEWNGNTLASLLFTRTANEEASGNPNHIGLKIVVAGQTIAERIGPCDPHGSFHLVGSGTFPNGDHNLSLLWRCSGRGPDDPYEDVGNNAHILKAHLHNSTCVAIGRFR